MAEIWTRATRQRQPTGVAGLAYPASFVFSGAGSCAAPKFADAQFSGSPVGSVIAITSTSFNARADFTLAKTPPVTGSKPWTLIALQYFPVTPTGEKGIIGLRPNANGCVFAANSGLLQFYTGSNYISSGISINAGLHCVALAHDGNGNGRFYYDGIVSDVTGLGATAASGTLVTLMNWDALFPGTFSAGLNAYSAFAAVIDTKVPDGVMRRVTGDKNPWQLFTPERRVSYFFPASGIPTLSAATAVSITSTTATPRVTVTF